MGFMTNNHVVECGVDFQIIVAERKIKLAVKCRCPDYDVVVLMPDDRDVDMDDFLK